jgi:hypothetical protein
LYRYQIQGPKALDVMRKVLGTEPPKLKFFAMGHVSIAGRHVRAQYLVGWRRITGAGRPPVAVLGSMGCR